MIEATNLTIKETGNKKKTRDWVDKDCRKVNGEKHDKLERDRNNTRIKRKKSKTNI